MSFYTDVLCNSPHFRDTAPVSALELLEPVTRAKVIQLLEDANAISIPLIVFETYRSRERQQVLFDRKATKLKEVGVHHYGLACDLVRDDHGQPSWKGDFSFMGRLAKRSDLVWGGDWRTFKDVYHVQRIAVVDQPRLFSGEWYPGDDYLAF